MSGAYPHFKSCYTHEELVEHPFVVSFALFRKIGPSLRLRSQPSRYISPTTNGPKLSGPSSRKLWAKGPRDRGIYRVAGRREAVSKAPSSII
jgi:hypothetical protein